MFMATSSSSSSPATVRSQYLQTFKFHPLRFPIMITLESRPVQFLSFLPKKSCKPTAKRLLLLPYLIITLRTANLVHQELLSSIRASSQSCALGVSFTDSNPRHKARQVVACWCSFLPRERGREYISLMFGLFLCLPFFEKLDHILRALNETHLYQAW
jgi:hypothetical protein